MPQSMQRAPCLWSWSVGHGSITWRQSATRSRTGRYGCLSRLNSMNPVTLPIAGLLGCRPSGSFERVLVRPRLDSPLRARALPAQPCCGGMLDRGAEPPCEWVRLLVAFELDEPGDLAHLGSPYLPARLLTICFHFRAPALPAQLNPKGDRKSTR